MNVLAGSYTQEECSPMFGVLGTKEMLMSCSLILRSALDTPLHHKPLPKPLRVKMIIER